MTIMTSPLQKRTNYAVAPLQRLISTFSGTSVDAMAAIIILVIAHGSGGGGPWGWNNAGHQGGGGGQQGPKLNANGLTKRQQKTVNWRLAKQAEKTVGQNFTPRGGGQQQQAQPQQQIQVVPIPVPTPMPGMQMMPPVQQMQQPCFTQRR